MVWGNENCMQLYDLTERDYFEDGCKWSDNIKMDNRELIILTGELN
jgi:hypothetical protein